jgi:hypothetical protein
MLQLTFVFMILLAKVTPDEHTEETDYKLIYNVVRFFLE